MQTLPTTDAGRRRRLVAAGALVTLTALAGAASRRTAAAPGTPPPAPTRIAAAGGGPVRFSAQLDRSAVHVGGDGLVRMELLVAAEHRDDPTGAPRLPTDLVVVLDRSGSMDGDKIVHARAAVHELIGALGEQDRFALVTYSDAAAVTIPLATANADARRRWLATVDAVGPSGGTNMSAGLDVALHSVLATPGAGRAPRVILISDGLANQGDASPEGLVARARRAARGELVLTTVGVGADFNEQLMTALADAGTGNYYYVERATDLGAVFAREFGAARATVASGLAVEIAPADGVRVVDAAGYPLEQNGDRVVFRPGALFAGQERRIWVTLDVAHDKPAERPLGAFAVTYTDGGVPQRVPLADTPIVTCVADEERFFERVDVSTWERAVVVDDYNKMKDVVARHVQAGERDAALGAVRRFKQEAASMNDRLSSRAVAKTLDELPALEAQVSDAFVGAEQRKKQNALGKAAGAAAYDARRPGSKY